MKPDEKLTLSLRLKICWSVLTQKEKHNHSSQVKSLKLFQCGYDCGFKDAMPRIKSESVIDFNVKS
jgi:hypothetical protein